MLLSTIEHLWRGILLLGGMLAVIGTIVGALRLTRRVRRSRFAEYGVEIRHFALPDDAAVYYAQWLHPKETPKTITQDEVRALRRFVRPGDLVVDIGAHSGDSTLPLALAAGAEGLTLALEPNPYVYKILKANARLNPDKTRIVPLNIAAAASDGPLVFHYSDGAYCNGGYMSQLVGRRHGHRQPLEVDGRDLEGLLRRDYAEWLPRLALIKIDTEGFDRQVIRALGDLIAERQPIVLCEFYRYLNQAEREEQFDLLAQLGYRWYRMAEGANLISSEITRAELMAERQFDLVALPLRWQAAAASMVQDELVAVQDRPPHVLQGSSGVATAGH